MPPTTTPASTFFPPLFLHTLSPRLQTTYTMKPLSVPPHHTINNDRKKEWAQCRSLMQSHSYLTCLCINCCTSHQCFAVLIHVLDWPHVFLFHLLQMMTVPYFFPLYPVVKASRNMIDHMPANFQFTSCLSTMLRQAS